MRRSTKAKTNEEIQLQGILDYIRDNPKPAALPLALREKMADHLAILDASIPSEDFFLSEFMQHVLAELISRVLGTKGGGKALTGFVIIHPRYFDFLNRGCSINKALDAFDDHHVEESVFELLCKHSPMTGRKMTKWRGDTAAALWEEARALLEAGRLLALPTETYYALAAHPFRDDALARLFDLKERLGKNLCYYWWPISGCSPGWPGTSRRWRSP